MLIFLIYLIGASWEFQKESLFRIWIQHSYPIWSQANRDVQIEMGPHRILGWQARDIVLDSLPQEVTQLYEQVAQGQRNLREFELELQKAWERFWGRPFQKPVLVAVLDTGIDVDHPLIQDQIWRNPKECHNWKKFIQCVDQKSLNDCIPEFLKPTEDYNQNGKILDCHGWAFTEGFWQGQWGHPDVRDNQGHGTHVAGLIRLINPWVKLLPIKVLTQNPRQPAKPFSLDSMDLMLPKNDSILSNAVLPRTLPDFIALGLQYGWDQGARVFHLSLGWPESLSTPLLRKTIDGILKQGGIIIAAAGNDFTYQTPHPCSIDGVICVGALRPDGSLAHFSNWGPTVFIYHFGVALASLWPLKLWKDNPQTPGFGLRVLSGTSQAAPIVTGLVSLALSHGIDWNELWHYHQPVKNPAPVWNITPSEKKPLTGRESWENSFENPDFRRRLALGQPKQKSGLFLGWPKKRIWNLQTPFFIHPLPPQMQVWNCRLRSHDWSLSGPVTCHQQNQTQALKISTPADPKIWDAIQILEVNTNTGWHQTLVEIKNLVTFEDLKTKSRFVTLTGLKDQIYFLNITDGAPNVIAGFFWKDENKQQIQVGLWTEENLFTWNWPFSGLDQEFDPIIEAVWFNPLKNGDFGVITVLAQEGQKTLRWDWQVGTPNYREQQENHPITTPRLWHKSPQKWPELYGVTPAVMTQQPPTAWDQWNPDLNIPKEDLPLAWRWGHRLESFSLGPYIKPWFWTDSPQGPVLWAAYQDHKTHAICRLQWNEESGFSQSCQKAAQATLDWHRHAPVWLLLPSGEILTSVLGYFWTFPNSHLAGSWVHPLKDQLMDWLFKGTHIWDSPLQVLGGLVLPDGSSQWIGLSNYEIWWFQKRKDEIIPSSRNSERFSFMPLRLFTGLHFPYVVGTRLNLFIPDGGGFWGGVKWIGTRFADAQKAVLVAPAAWRLQVESPCQVWDYPVIRKGQVGIPIRCGQDLHVWPLEDEERGIKK